MVGPNGKAPDSDSVMVTSLQHLDKPINYAFALPN